MVERFSESAINNLFHFTQEKLKPLYASSVILQNLDNLIFTAFLAVFVVSTFLPSDTIGIVSLIAAGLTFVKLLVKPETRLEASTADLWLLAYFMIVIVSLFGSSAFTLSFHGFIKIVIYLLFYLSVRLYLKDNKDKIPFIIGVIALCAGSEAVVGLLQNSSQVAEISTWQDVSNINPEEVMTRVYGTLKPLNPNLLGGYLVAAIPALFGMTGYCFLENKKTTCHPELDSGSSTVAACSNLIGGRCRNKFGMTNKTTLIYSILTILASVTLFATGCRGAYLGLMVILAGIFAVGVKFLWHNHKKTCLTIIGSAVAFITGAILFVGSLRVRVLSIFSFRADSSNSFRFNVYQSSWEMFKDNWLLGIGIGNQNFREVYGLYMKTGFDALSAYNIFLEIAVESGVFALIAFVGFIIILVKNGVRFIINSDDKRAVIIASTALVCICALMVHGLVDTVFFRPQIQFVFWTMVAILQNFSSHRELSEAIQ